MARITKRWFEEEIRLRECLRVAQRNTAINGTMAAEVVWDHSPLPICTIWCRWTDEKKTTLAILNMYTPEKMRRLGVATFLFEQMVQTIITNVPACTTITTEKGTEFSRPWLVKRGFKGSDRRGWVYEVKRPSPSPAAHTTENVKTIRPKTLGAPVAKIGDKIVWQNNPISVYGD